MAQAEACIFYFRNPKSAERQFRLKAVIPITSSLRVKKQVTFVSQGQKIKFEFTSSNESTSFMTELRIFQNTAKSQSDLGDTHLWAGSYIRFLPHSKRQLSNSAIAKELRQREREFSTFYRRKLFVGTWNVNGRAASEPLEAWLRTAAADQPDIYVLGFQEMDLAKEAFYRVDSKRTNEWLDAIERVLGTGYSRVDSKQLVGLFIVCYIRVDLRPLISEVGSDGIGTGVLSVLGNKGAVALRFRFQDSYFCFVSCHLASDLSQMHARKIDYKKICKRLTFLNPVPPSRSDYSAGGFGPWVCNLHDVKLGAGGPKDLDHFANDPGVYGSEMPPIRVSSVSSVRQEPIAPARSSSLQASARFGWIENPVIRSPPRERNTSLSNLQEEEEHDSDDAGSIQGSPILGEHELVTSLGKSDDDDDDLVYNFDFDFDDLDEEDEEDEDEVEDEDEYFEDDKINPNVPPSSLRISRSQEGLVPLDPRYTYPPIPQDSAGEDAAVSQDSPVISPTKSMERRRSRQRLSDSHNDTMKTNPKPAPSLNMKVQESIFTIFDCDHLFWMGDLNYRIELDDQEIKQMIESNDFQMILCRDQRHILAGFWAMSASQDAANDTCSSDLQLTHERTSRRVFHDFDEAPIVFQPTYKFDIGTSRYDTSNALPTVASEKKRSPAWCDRILWFRNPLHSAEYDESGDPWLRSIWYKSCMDLSLSDHKPVMALFDIKVRSLNEQLLRRIEDDLRTQHLNDGDGTIGRKKTLKMMAKKVQQFSQDIRNSIR
ncbi:Endonuclease/exonuclease/phosphatase [Polychytrium aggregatum]|uniref:Endonuclease/exonuclease/phosphatase n=1 Tax=Polychytrium aggregatum TaxID=110093 RepID=UPI0022FF0879|nr:Endonuclease/exonuclease/phosphatase [Polychytrium aggregatum]KAI9207176.1 Endonuclease/exonuclease/phosphatase [Polychytrium aggregatum]